MLLLRLIDADVYQNLKPGALAKLGIDLERLHEQHAGLISVSISGFRTVGCAGTKAYDLLMQAESGLADITGAPAEPAGRCFGGGFIYRYVCIRGGAWARRAHRVVRGENQRIPV